MAANEAIGLGYGGISKVQLACGLSRKAIAKGIHEIQNGIQPPEGKIRHIGAGRKSITEQDPNIVRALEQWIKCGTMILRQSGHRSCRSGLVVRRLLSAVSNYETRPYRTGSD